MTRGGDVGEDKRPGLLRRAWLSRLEPNLNKRGQFAPAMQRQWLSIVLAVAVALAFEWVLFGLLAEDWTWPWVQVRELNGTSDSLVQPAIALLTPVIALVTAVFAYRKSTIALAESQRADVAAFQQRFIDAAKLLADDNASTRIAGATAMGSLARDWVENRQECVNVLCGYLKVKPADELMAIDRGGERPSYAWHGGEDVVRREVVSQIRRVLTRDKSGELLTTVVDVDLDEAWLPPDTDFRGAYFAGAALFVRAVFTGRTTFDQATFRKLAFFIGARFEGQSDFFQARFCGPTLFNQATFSESVEFLDVVMESDVKFLSTQFADYAQFDDCRFDGGAAFTNARFAADVSFDRARFSDRTRFIDTLFEDSASFDGAHFSSPPSIRLLATSTVPSTPGAIVGTSGEEPTDVAWVRGKARSRA